MTEASRARRRAVGIVYFASLVQGMVGLTPAALSGVLKTDLGVDERIYAAQFLPTTAVALLVSLTAHRWQRWRPLAWLFPRAAFLAAFYLCTIASLAVVPAWLHPAILIGGAVLVGVCIGVMGIALNTAAVRLFPERRGMALAMLHGVLAAGSAIEPLLIPPLRDAGAWYLVPLIVAALALIPALLALRGEPSCFTDGKLGSGVSWRGLPPVFFARGLPGLLYGVAEASIVSWAVLYLIETRSLDMAAATGALSIFWAAMTVGRVVATFGLRYVTPKQLTLGLSILMAVAFFAVAGARTEAQAMAAYALAGLACSAVAPLVMAMAADHFPDQPSAVSAWFSATLLVGLAAGSYGLGPVRSLWPLPWIYHALVFVALAMGAVVWWLGRQRPSSSA